MQLRYYVDRMKAPLLIRPLTDAERQALRQGLRCHDAFTLRRCQVFLHSAKGQTPAQVAAAVGLSAQAVRDALRAFAAEGLGALKRKPPLPKQPNAAWDRRRNEDLKDLLHRSPRDFGKPTSLWTLALVAAVCHEKGWTERALSAEAIRLVLKRLGVAWKRAKHWITSPDPAYAAKKKSATA
jgi:transposase